MEDLDFDPFESPDPLESLDPLESPDPSESLEDPDLPSFEELEDELSEDPPLDAADP